VVKPYGHFDIVANNPAIDPVGESLPNTEIFRRLAARMGFDDPCFADSDAQIAAAAFRRTGACASYDWEVASRRGWQRLDLPARYAPFAQGNFPTPSGRCEFFSQRLADQGLDPRPAYVPPHEGPVSRPDLAQRFPLAMISPPARNFLNSTSSMSTACAPPRASRGSTSTRPMRPRAASPMASRYACSTTAARCACAPA